MLPVLDLRTAAAARGGRHACCVNIPLDELPLRMHELPEKGATLRIYHDDADELKKAAALLSARGYAIELMSELPREERPTRARLWKPTTLLEEALAFAGRPGRAIDLGCGSGREAVHLAMLEWRVTAIDVLPDALEKARDLARRNSVQLRTVCRDLRKEGMPEGEYELVTMFRYWHAPLGRAIGERLAKGGVVVVEAFHPDDPLRHGNTVTPEEVGAVIGVGTRIARVTERNGRVFTQWIGVGDY